MFSKFNTKSLKAFATLLLVMSIIFSSGCNLFKSDEQLITERLDSFTASYNAGDIDGAIESFDTKTKTLAQSMLGIGNALLGGIIGFDLDLKDLFGLSAAFSGCDMLEISDMNNLTINSETATVDVTLTMNEPVNGTSVTQSATFHLVKENGDWFISNLTEN